MGEALKPLNRLDATARDEHSDALKAHARDLDLNKLKADESRADARKALKGGVEARPFDVDEPEAPKGRRYVVNDTTYEALGYLAGVLLAAATIW
jgi:hypothetical protein